MRGSLLALPVLAAQAAAAAAPSYAEGVCDNAKISGFPFCDSSLGVDARVQDLLARIPLHDAAGLLADNSSAVASLDLPAYPWWNEALHGVALSPGVTFRDPTRFATSFPQVISTAASFNRSLFYQIADVVSTEARAFYNSENAGLTFWTPNVNIYRDPRWGRGQETPGEDPYLTGEYAVSFVRGLQGEAMEGETPFAADSDNGKFLKISGCCKHFSSYSQEVPRHRNDAIVSKQDQADTYFPAFEDCVKRGHVSSVMCSYNAVNGIPACADKGLLTGLVRQQWKFDGYITSDCAAVADVIYEHHYTQSPEHTCATTLNAGMDLNCGEFLRQHLASALETGIVSKQTVYTALGNLFKVKMRLGMFEKGGQPFKEITAKSIDTPAHKQLALEAAQQSVVLLKNEDNVLPLDASQFVKDGALALVGPHFNASDALLGNYNGTPSHIVTPLEGISSYTSKVAHGLGCRVAGEFVPDFDEAIKVAKAADRVVAFVGLDQTQEKEEIDRYHLKLPGFQKALLDRILAVATRPIVIVVISGGAVDLSPYKYHPKVGAIVFGGYLGQAGGQAIADVLFGKYNPSGRLTQTFYSAEYTQVMSIYDMHMRPTEETGNPGRTYRFYTGVPVYEFGHGLSYSDFGVAWKDQAPLSELDGVALSRSVAEELTTDDNTCAVQFAVTVKNNGKADGRQTVLVYAEPPLAGQNGRPLKSLVGFQGTPVLAAKQQAELQFCLRSKSFALAGEDGKWTVTPGTWTLHVGELRHKIVMHGTLDSANDVARNFEPVEFSW